MGEIKNHSRARRRRRRRKNKKIITNRRVNNTFIEYIMYEEQYTICLKFKIKVYWC
jgi:hypothetical protein